MHITLRVAILLIAGPLLAHAQPLSSPDTLYGQLFHDVQMLPVFADGKTFVDCTPKRKIGDIMYDYGMMKGPAMDLKKFVADNFELPASPPVNNVAQQSNVAKHMAELWPLLSRSPDLRVEGSSLLPLPHPYIVPGGRFREIYYWDSYFTMLGLKQSGKVDMIENMINNFAYLIDAYGHIPNGNRSYYLSRSQPPFFALMVELLASIKGEGVYGKYLGQLEKEYAYWMAGDKDIAAGQAKLRVVKMPDGSLLNRYWDDAATPRPESYREDVLTADTAVLRAVATMKFAGQTDRDNFERVFRRNLYSHLRAGAASGWDFSTRWFADGQNIATIETTNFAPVDLNCLLYQLEITLGKAYAKTGKPAQSKQVLDWAAERARAIQKYCFSKTLGYYVDYHWANDRQASVVTPAGMFAYCLLPLKQVQGTATKAAGLVSKRLLQPGGVLTTAIISGQQWDAPNGWAPLQWMTIWGLERTAQKRLAADIANRWIALNKAVYARTGKLMEKYNVENIHLDAGGGEYPGQDGFGWTNGVLLALMAKYDAPSTNQ